MKFFSPNIKYKLNNFVYSNYRQATSKKILSTCLIIFISFFLGLMLISSICQKWMDFNKILSIIFFGWTKNLNKLNLFFSNMGILIISSISFIIANKTGLFNMGISGQLMASATISTLVCHFGNIPKGLNQFTLIILGILIGATISGIIGFLKAFLNVNEVVSSIMLNWIIYFLSILILKIYVPKNSSNTYTKPIANDLIFRMQISNQYVSFIPIVIIAIVCLIFAFIYLKYTIIGKKQCIIGLNKDGALAAGYNTKFNIITSMIVSGCIAGILGNMVFCSLAQEMPISVIGKMIPQEGFNGISIGLISMNNPIATIPISFFFSLIQSSTDGLQLIGINSNMYLILFGIIVYGAAIISFVLRFKPYWWILGKIKKKRTMELKYYENSTLSTLITLANEQKMLINQQHKIEKKLTKKNNQKNLSLLNEIYQKNLTWFKTLGFTKNMLDKQNWLLINSSLYESTLITIEKFKKHFNYFIKNEKKLVENCIIEEKQINEDFLKNFKKIIKKKLGDN